MTADDASGNLDYLIYLPEKYGEDDGTAWPLVLFLHGRGESFGPLSLVTKWGPPKFAQRGDSLPFVLVSPQCPRSGRWSDGTRLNQLSQLLEVVLKTYRVDPDRIYLTGLSMGGFGSWALAAKLPHRFAAVVPVCGGGDPADADTLKSLPMWVFHGTDDKTVTYDKSVEMVDAIRAAGGRQIRFTSLEHVGHNSWSSAFALPELYVWLLSQSRAAKN